MNAESPLIADPRAATESLRSDLSALYALSQNSKFVFASPLGPLSAAGRAAYLPRLVFFGPPACGGPRGVPCLAGVDPADLRSSRALVALVSRLASDSETGHALNLSFFPLVDVGGAASGGPGRGLAS